MKKILKAFLVFAAAIIAILAIIICYFFVGSAPIPKKITWGVDFSQSQAEYLGLNWKELYLSIIREEFQFPLKKSLGCPYNKLEILLTYLVPFIDYPFNISIDWYINLELKYLIIKLLKEKSLNNVEIKTNLINYLWDNYIKKNILQEEYLGNLISQWISKIKT